MQRAARRGSDALRISRSWPVNRSSSGVATQPAVKKARVTAARFRMTHLQSNRTSYMSLRGKDFRCEIEAEVDTKYRKMSDFLGLGGSALGSIQPPKMIAGEW